MQMYIKVKNPFSCETNIQTFGVTRFRVITCVHKSDLHTTTAYLSTGVKIPENSGVKYISLSRKSRIYSEHFSNFWSFN